MDELTLRLYNRTSLISRTTPHSAAIKAVQFNPHRAELLATSGAKGELYITDLNNVKDPFRLGTATARADDFDALDWNKVVPHIMATAGSGGFVTVWDVKAKKESLTLNNYGRKPVSAVAWNPDLPTKLATASASDQDPLILLWDLRNSSVPERILKGHEQGVLSLSWCGQDNELLLSCGKDNRNICWNPLVGEQVGEFPIVTNWTFQTRFHPEYPHMVATASFDGKIAVQTLQNTNANQDTGAVAANHAQDAADFFANVQTQPQSSSFSLAKPPKWLKRPVGASFGFGGKLVRFHAIKEADAKKPSTKSKVEITKIETDPRVETSIAELQSALKGNDLTAICESKVESASSQDNKNDWKVIQNLISTTPRKGLLSYLGFADKTDTSAENGETPTNGETSSEKELAAAAADPRRLSNFFGTGDNDKDSDFLADLAANKGARTNKPFSIYTGSESDVDKQITKALMLGGFEKAMDMCLKENRMSEAFMIAICGGQKCIDKVQAAYFAQQSNGPNYLRLLASVVGKNLWDLVYNADLENWREVMATLCTYADEAEFPDLCEALGDRLDEQDRSRGEASFCYLAGSKLEKVVPIWIQEMKETEQVQAEGAGDESAFSIHVQALQHFIEKVSIFRKATTYEDKDIQQNVSDYRLGPLYTKYAEYADVVASYGHLELAEQYLSLLPAAYGPAETARDRVQKATKRVPATSRKVAAPALRTNHSDFAAAMQQPYSAMQPTAPANPFGGQAAQNSYAPPAASAIPAPIQRYGASAYQQPHQAPSSYAPASAFAANSYQPPAQNLAIPPQGGQPPPKTTGPPPPSRIMDGSNWNDLPEGFSSKPPTRRVTPAMGAPPTVTSPFLNQPDVSSPPQYGAPPMGMARERTPLPPPPKAGQAPPPMADRSVIQPPVRPTSAAANAYAPLQSAPQQQPIPPPMQRQVSAAYQPPPSAAPPSNRYAPAPGTVPTPGPPGMGGPPTAGRPIAPNPYAAAPAPGRNQSFAPPPQSQPPMQAAPPPRAAPPAAAPPPQGPPRGVLSGPPPTSRPGTAQSQGSAAPTAAAYRKYSKAVAQSTSQLTFRQLQVTVPTSYQKPSQSSTR